jgi:copper resistance protein B
MSTTTNLAALAAIASLAAAFPAAAQEVPPAPKEDHSGMDMSGDMQGMDMPAAPTKMEMGGMQGGKAPADARNSDDYSDGYRNSTLPNYEMADQISIPKILIDELEFANGNEGQGIGWSFLVTNGTDNSKLWLRSQGLKNSKEERLDPETSAEALWWHSNGAYWGTLVGVRQDIGKGATTWLAAGVEGLAPYWFDVQLTGYVGTDGRLAARTKLSYEALLTNRLILTPQVEANVYSKQSRDRELGSGFSNVELSARMRYEVSRKFAPYIGYVWERSLGGSADFRRARGEGPGEHRFVAGLRLWW